MQHRLMGSGRVGRDAGRFAAGGAPALVGGAAGDDDADQDESRDQFKHLHIAIHYSIELMDRGIS